MNKNKFNSIKFTIVYIANRRSPVFRRNLVTCFDMLESLCWFDFGY